MSDIPGTSRAQTLFLRAFHTHPDGPPADLWPSPAIFRKWMRSPAFAAAMDDILATFRFQSDLHLAAVANRAAITLRFLDVTDSRLRTEQHTLLHVLRLSHLRQRFETDNERELTLERIFLFMRCFNPKTPVALVLDSLKKSFPHAIRPADDDFRAPTKEQLHQLLLDCPPEIFSPKAPEENPDPPTTDN